MHIMADEQTMDHFLQEYAQIQGMNPVGTPRKAAAIMLEEIETFLSDADPRFTHTRAMAAKYHESVDPGLLARELKAGEPSFDELKTAALEAMAEDLTIHAPAVGKRIREEMSAALEVPKDCDMAEAVRKHARRVNVEIAAEEAHTRKRRRDELTEIFYRLDTLRAVEKFLARGV